VAVFTVAACSSSGNAGKNTGKATNSGSGIPAGRIKIGALYPLSGPAAQFGLGEYHAQQALVARLNASGGIAGHMVDLVAENDQGTPAIAITMAEKLVSDHVAAIINTGTPGSYPASIPVFMKAKVPVVTNANPDDQYTDGTKFPYMFITGWPLSATAKSWVAIAQQKHITKVGVAADTSGFGQQTANDFVSQAKAAGLDVVKQVSYDTGATDLSTPVAQLRSAGAEAVVIGGLAGYDQAFAAMRTSGWTPWIFAYASPNVEPKRAGLQGTPQEARAYAVCSGYCAPEGGTIPARLSVIAKVVSAVEPGSDPTFEGLFGNDSLLILKYAIETAKSLNSDAIKSAIESIQNMSFTLDSLKYTFSSTEHGGLTTPEPMAAVRLGLGQYGVPFTEKP
jgi:branched-chain amino acid transport system substrate-binding protein